MRGAGRLSEPPAIGLARLPRRLGALLDEAAGNTAEAARELERLIETADVHAADTIERREQNGDRITHDLARELRHSRLADADRGRILALAEALDDVVDTIDAAAHEAGCDCRPTSTLLAGVLRDATRASARAVQALGGGSFEIERELAAIRALVDEGERIMRAASAELLRAGEPIEAIRGKTCLERVDAALRANRTLAETVERTALAVV
jgi:uncharacterized protein Yka (UPF0111/DUF47 family)